MGVSGGIVKRPIVAVQLTLPADIYEQLYVIMEL